MTKKIGRLKLDRETLRRIDGPMWAAYSDPAPTDFCTYFCASGAKPCLNPTTADCTN